VPNIGFIKRAVIGIDRWLNTLLAKFGLQRLICWRYLIYAKKENL